MRMNLFLLSAVVLCASCAEDENIIKKEDLMKPNTETSTGNNNDANNVPAENRFTVNSTVAEVISEPAFGKFGYLLFPVDRNVSRSMTLARLSALGIPTEFHVYEGLGHGFGIGTGTVADGWVNDALKFWQKNMKIDGGVSRVHVSAD